MGINLIEWDGDPGGYGILPASADPQRGEIRYQGSGTEFLQKLGNFHNRISIKQEEGDAQPGEILLHLFQPGQHEMILPAARSHETRSEAEDGRQGGGPAYSQLLGVEQGPVVIDSLVPAHPVDHRTILQGML
ncbi:MAG: hypothetical protein BWY13_01275 [Euryarchaeota archaeon ADurb.Bin190]|nr:MAG: hypothetical protein BWY13_01275 [Euryarchaeota archaeon ADurb.Bin190]